MITLLNILTATGGGGSGVRVEPIPFDINNPLAFILWVVQVLAPISTAMVNFFFTQFELIKGAGYTSIAQVVLAPATLGFIWVGQWIKGLLV